MKTKKKVQTKPQEFPHDKFYQFSDWRDQTKMYGGINQAVYNLASYAGGNDLMMNIFSHKLISWIFALFSMGLFFILSKEVFHTDPSRILRVIFWNPLFILEILGSGHNDSVMLFFTIASFFFLYRKQWEWSALFLSFATQIKITPILFVPFLLVWLLKKREIIPLCRFLLVFIVSNGIIFWGMQTNPIDLYNRITYSTNLYWQSLPAVLSHILPFTPQVMGGIFIILAITTLFQQYHKKEEPIKMYTKVLFIYLLFFLPAYWNWYSLWLLFLIPFITDSSLKRAIISLTFVSLLLYPFYWISLRFDYTQLIWTIGAYLLLSVFPLFSFFRKKIPTF